MFQRQLYCPAFGDRFKQMICLTLGSFTKATSSCLMQDSMICLTGRLQKKGSHVTSPSPLTLVEEKTCNRDRCSDRLPTSLVHPRAAQEHTTAPWKCLLPVLWGFDSGFCNWHFKVTWRLMLPEGGKESQSGTKDINYCAQQLIWFVQCEFWIGVFGFLKET